MEDREVLGRMGEPVDEDREWLRWLGLKPGPGLVSGWAGEKPCLNW